MRTACDAAFVPFPLELFRPASPCWVLWLDWGIMRSSYDLFSTDSQNTHRLSGSAGYKARKYHVVTVLNLS